MTCFIYSRKPTSKEKRKAADDFSDDLRDEYWEYGRCNDDFVIFISTEDRQVFFLPTNADVEIRYKYINVVV